MLLDTYKKLRTEIYDLDKTKAPLSILEHMTVRVLALLASASAHPACRDF